MEELTLSAETKNIEVLSDWVNSRLEEAGCPMKAQMQIDIAIDEIFSNIAGYAYGDETGMVTAAIEVSDHSAVLRFTDSGMPFNPLEVRTPDLCGSAEDREIGGLGIFMVRKSMDEVTYEYRDHNNVLTIRKNFKGGSR